MKKFMTSESVTEGHPDKLCDYISDSVLDACLEEDENSRVACEVACGKDMVFVTGEITTNAVVDIEKIVRNAIKEIGFTEESGIDPDNSKVIVNVSKQSLDIAMGTNDTVGGAGDQGIMFGYASRESDNYMPLAISLAHSLTKRLAEVRKEGILSYLRPDGKSQVTVEYDDGVPKRVDTVVISTQHDENVDINTLKEDIMEHVIKYAIPNELLDDDTLYYINPTGRFVIGGPLGDSGVTGRKIIVDTYGGYARHGGGAFSGKDATKVDRSACYMARFVAKNIVANGFADKCEIQLSYVIGVSKPLSIYLNTFGTNKISEEEIIKIIENNFDLTPKGIIDRLNLRKPIYKQTTNYGHFGKENMPWEEIIELKTV